jgi:hypothetical protein
MRSCIALVAALFTLNPNGLAGTQTRQPVVFSTPPQVASLTVRAPNAQPRRLDALVAYTLTSALTDDTLAGTLNISFVSISKKGKPPIPLTDDLLQGLPQTISRQNVSAGFVRQTSCPRLKLQIAEVALEGSAAVIESFVIVLPEKQDDEVSQLLCFWTTQINSNRVRKGIVARINRLIQVEDDPQ